MKKFYLLFILLFFTMQQLTAQTVETFESLTTGQSNFTSNGKTFNLTNSYISFTTVQFAGLGYNASNRFIQTADGNTTQSMGQTGSITAATGNFKLNSLWIYLTGNSAQNAGSTFDGAPGSVTLVGKLGGVQQFSVVKNTSGANTGLALPGNGFINVNFATDGAANYTNINIDQLEIQLSSNYDYFAIDNFTWVDGVALPTVTTTTATNVGSVKATVGGNVTSDGGESTVQRGIVWATATGPTIANNKFQIGTGSGTFTNTITGLTPASTIYYRAYVTNSAGTTYGAESTFNTTAALGTAATGHSNVSCNGGANGTATVIANGGKTPYTYSWSPSGGTGATASGLASNTYTVTITDNEGTQITRVFTVSQPSAINPGAGSQTNVSCFGGTNGSASVSVTGGTFPYSYSWSPSGGFGATASNLAAGTYTVTITDDNTCEATKTFIIGQPVAALDATSSVTNVSCFGGSNGTATATPTGGTPGYTYLWTNGATTATASALAAGTYGVTITDANACTKTLSGIVVGGPVAALSATSSSTSVSCFGGTNGTASVSATGGTSGYTYLWSNGATTATATGLLAGTYFVTITDANACTFTVNNIVVGQPSVIVGTPSTTPVSCNGGNNGTASVSASGGTPGYTYLWSNGATTATATGLLAGTYFVTITDANACTKTVTGITVGQPAVLNGVTSFSGVSCNGGFNGMASVTPSGGTSPYTYLWDTGATTQSITLVPTGTYSVTITDANACTVTKTVTVTEPSALVSSQGTVNNTSCNGGSNGSATVIVTGGTLPYSYVWSPSGGTGVTASGLSQGTYTVTVTDNNGCETTQSFTITQPAALSVTRSQTDILCNGAATGSATVNVTGGTGAYTYVWSPSGGTAATATGLTAGTYSVTIKDANLCQTTESFTITQPSALIVSPAAQTNIGCRGDVTGSATVNVSGGTGTYTYSWSPSGGTAATASGLGAGTYTATVTDGNLCQATQSFTITEPAAILSASTASTGVSCFGGFNGSASVTVSGGTSGYSYLWAPLGGTTATITGRPAGNYTCTITDANGCTLVKNITISTPTELTATASNTNVSCNGGTNGTATVSVTGGTAGYSYSWSPTGGTGATASGLEAGTYTVTVTDANTCQTSATVTITEPTVLIATPSQSNVLCNGGATGSATVSASGGTPVYTYAWSPSGGTSATATGLTSGNYNCLITDAKGCSTTLSFIITQPSILVASTSQINATCTTGGQASVTPSGGTTPYTYLWSNGETTQLVSNLAAGPYSCTITDGNGCTLVKNFTITTINTLTAVTSQTDVLCNGSNTATATVVPSGAPGPFTYVWAPSGGNAATATGLTAGNYSVTITSVNGCSIVKNFTITEPTALVVTPSQTNVSCNGGTNGSATVNVTGGTGAYSYVWSPSGGTAATATGLSAGTYTVTITDANLCEVTQSFTITEPAALIATPSQTNVSCNGGTNGSATVAVTGGTGAYSYVWSPTGGTAATATGLAAGTYTVTITDANLCQTTATVTITEPVVLSATTSQVNVSCNGQSDGTATVNAAGGTGAYTYAWSPSGGTAATASGLSAGTYTVLITDANGCSLTESVTISTIPDVTAPVPNVTNLPAITNYCSVLPAQITIPTATDNCSGIITGTTTDPLTYTAVGNYIITWSYTDASGNTATQQQNISVTASPLNQVTFANAAFTFNGSVRTVQVANLPAGASVVYATAPSTGTLNGATNAGVYTVTATVSPAATSPNCSPIMLTAQLTINKAAQQIAFGALPAKILGVNNNFNLDAIANSGLPVRYSFTYTSALPPATVTAAGVVSMIRSGQLVITAHQDGDANYLAAADVSQTLVIKNNDVTVTSITIGGQVYNNPAKDLTYLMTCGQTNVNIVTANNTNATITPSANFTITPPKPGIYTQNLTVTSEDGSTTANYTIKVEKPFGFFDIVKQKFNNVLLVNNNPLTNGGYIFVAYQWFKNGQLIGTGQYYTAGNESNNVLDPTATYSVKMTTLDGKVLQTCGSQIAHKNSLEAKLYPNPIEAGKVLTVEADFPAEEIENMQITLYTVSGKLIKSVQSSSVITEIQLPPSAEGNMYLVVLENGNMKKSFKVIVK